VPEMKTLLYKSNTERASKNGRVLDALFFVLILEVIFVIDNFFNCVMHDDAKMYK